MKIVARKIGDRPWPDATPPGGPGTDTDAIHDNVAAEINVITEKTSPVSADILLMEDSEAANVKKKVQGGNLYIDAGYF